MPCAKNRPLFHALVGCGLEGSAAADKLADKKRGRPFAPGRAEQPEGQACGIMKCGEGEWQRNTSRSALGGLYVAGTRVSLASVVIQFRQGASPETILQNFPSLASLENVTGAVAYYLANPPRG